VSEVLLILITRTGMILNKKVSISENITRDQLYRFSSYLTSELGGFSLHDVKERLFDAMRSGLNAGVEQHLAIDIAQIALSIREEPDIFVEGIENILHIPEMTQEGPLKAFLHLIEKKNQIWPVYLSRVMQLTVSIPLSVTRLMMLQ
jgi:transcriptional regulator of heat shock response